MEVPQLHHKFHSQPQDSVFLGVGPFKAKRTISYKDKEVNVALHGPNPENAPQQVKTTDDRGFSCMKCQML